MSIVSVFDTRQAAKNKLLAAIQELDMHQDNEARKLIREAQSLMAHEDE